MADRHAVATGNWSSTSTWNGGTLPAADDVVYANGFVVTVDGEYEASQVRNGTGGGSYTAGGSFTVNGNTIKLTADVFGESGSWCVRMQNGATLIGDSTGTSSVATRIETGSCMTGTAYGGGSYGVQVFKTGLMIGDCYGGASQRGAFATQGGVISGNAYSTDANKAGALLSDGGILIGSATGSTNTSGAHGCEMLSGVFIGDAIGGASGNDGVYQTGDGHVLLYSTSQPSSGFAYRTTGDGTYRLLTNANASHCSIGSGAKLSAEAFEGITDPADVGGGGGSGLDVGRIVTGGV